MEELHSILKEIPTELPPGSEDIYGLDTGIMWGSEDLEWAVSCPSLCPRRYLIQFIWAISQNGGPSGCGGGTSDVQPTPEQKAKFKRAVDIVTELTANGA